MNYVTTKFGTQARYHHEVLVAAKSIAHLWLQGVRSTRAVNANVLPTCAYHGTDGRACAVGALLAWDADTAAFEGLDLRSVCEATASEGTAAVRWGALRAALDAVGINVRDPVAACDWLRLLRSLQRLHDTDEHESPREGLRAAWAVAGQRQRALRPGHRALALDTALGLLLGPLGGTEPLDEAGGLLSDEDTTIRAVVLKTVAHAAMQGPALKDGACVYRAEGGACAVGCHLPRDIGAADVADVNYQAVTDSTAAATLRPWLARAGVPVDVPGVMGMLRELQAMHDGEVSDAATLDARVLTLTLDMRGTCANAHAAPEVVAQWAHVNHSIRVALGLAL